MEFPTFINWTSPLTFYGLLGGIFYSNSRLPDQTFHSFASELGMHCLHNCPTKRMVWVKLCKRKTFVLSRKFIYEINLAC